MATIVGNSQYGSIYQDAQGCFVYDPTDPTGFGIVSWPCPQTVTPKIVSSQGGVSITAGQTTLDKILGTITSLAALSVRAPYVPTQAQPVNPYGAGIYSPLGAGLGSQAVNREIANNNALGTVEAWVKTHPIPVAIVVAIGVAYLVPSPRQGRR